MIIGCIIGEKSKPKKRIGKERAYRVACAIEKVFLIFGRDQVGGTKDGGL